MLMKKIDLHISKGFLKSFMLTLLAFLNLFLLSQIFKVIKLVSEGKLDGKSAILFMLALIPKILIDITPLSILLGGLFAISAMASNLEIISLKTSGISFKRIILFPVLISLLVSCGIFYISDKVAPKFVEKTKLLRGYNRERNIQVTKRKAFLRGEGDYIYYMGMINTLENSAQNVQFIDLNSSFDKIQRIVTSEKAHYNPEKKIWELSDAHIYFPNTGISKNTKLFSEEKYSAEPDSFITIQKDPKGLTNSEIKDILKDIRAVGGDTKEYIQELAKRYSFPFASIIICFIGLSLGSRYVRGASVINVGIAVLLGYGYYLLEGIFEAFSKNGYLNPFVGSWIPNILFIILGVYLVNRAEY